MLPTFNCQLVRHGDVQHLFNQKLQLETTIAERL